MFSARGGPGARGSASAAGSPGGSAGGSARSGSASGAGYDTAGPAGTDFCARSGSRA